MNDELQESIIRKEKLNRVCPKCGKPCYVLYYNTSVWFCSDKKCNCNSDNYDEFEEYINSIIKQKGEVKYYEKYSKLFGNRFKTL